MSDLIDRYVMAVAANLPKADRDDVPAELRDILYSKVEAREADLGRRLTAKEEEALLRAYGHPLVVAASYGKHQTLIGPAVYPFYIFTLKVVGGILLALIVLKFIVAAVAGYPLLGDDSDIGEALLTAGGIITLVFALIERFGKPEKLASKWRVSQLPHLGAPTARRTFEVMFEFFAAGLAALWWMGVVRFPDAAPSFMDLSLGPVWDTLRWPILAFLLLQMAADLFELASPGLVRVNAGIRIGYHLLGLAILGVLWRADHWIDVTVTLADRPELAQRLNENFNRGFKVGLAVTAFVFIFEIGRTALRLVRYGRLLRTQSA
jgi:hypothetical protein